MKREELQEITRSSGQRAQIIKDAEKRCGTVCTGHDQQGFFATAAPIMLNICWKKYLAHGSSSPQWQATLEIVRTQAERGAALRAICAGNEGKQIAAAETVETGCATLCRQRRMYDKSASNASVLGLGKGCRWRDKPRRMGGDFTVVYHYRVVNFLLPFPDVSDRCYNAAFWHRRRQISLLFCRRNKSFNKDIPITPAFCFSFAARYRTSLCPINHVFACGYVFPVGCLCGEKRQLPFIYTDVSLKVNISINLLICFMNQLKESSDFTCSLVLREENQYIFWRIIWHKGL